MNKLLSSVFGLAVAAATFGAQAQAVKGDAQAGAKLNAMCIGCHGIPGYQASFPQVYRVPMISGQGAKFIENALNDYKKGDRKHPTMRDIAGSLSEQNIADLAAYYSQHGVSEGDKPAAQPAAQPTERAASLIKAGNCTSCHGTNFNTPIDPSYPKLAGQHADYLLTALRSYTLEGNFVWGRNHPSMSGTLKAASKNLSPREFDAQLRAVAAYISSLPSELKTVPESRFR